MINSATKPYSSIDFHGGYDSFDLFVLVAIFSFLFALLAIKVGGK